MGQLSGRARALACVALLSGCDAFDATLLDEAMVFPSSAGARDDAGRKPPPPAADACASEVELCNAADDDCDGKIDEDAEADCALPHAIGACASGGTCVLAACEKGYLDCNERDRDGCEQSFSTLSCGACGTGCTEDGGLLLPDAGSVQVGSGRPDAGGDVAEPDPAPDGGGTLPQDAGMMPCTASPERCNNADDDCDGKLDETPADCELEACVASAPSYRGMGCDQCVCAKCESYVTGCQNSADAHWAMLCRDVTECYVTNSLAGRCGSNEDCYGTGAGPCAGEINLAAGGTSETDASRTITGCSANANPPTACSAVTVYRDECIRGLCQTECAQ